MNYLKKYGKKGVYIEFSGKTSTYSKDDDNKQIAVADKVTIIFANSKKEETTTSEDNEPDENIF